MNNFRDIGYSNVKKGMLFRGGEISCLSNEDRDFLTKKCHIKTIIDLRTIEELNEKSDEIIEGVKNLHMPLLNREDMTLTPQQLPDMFDCYRKVVGRNKKDFWTKLFDVLLDNNDGAIMYHCTQGKDRTGIITAIILSALGVDRNIIFDDYLLTNKFMSMPDEYKKYEEGMPEEVLKIFHGLFFVDKDFLDETFKEINVLYGSTDNFLEECCSLDKTKLERLKAKYLAKIA